jgi:hypothetical protein
MDVETITVERTEAIRMWQKYQTHKHNQNKIDAEIERTYKLIAEGKVLIDALGAIANAGVNEAGQPKLAIGRADQKWTFCHLAYDGSAIMFAGDVDRWNQHPYPHSRMAATLRYEFKADTFPRLERARHLQALIPHIPPEIRPRRGLQNYHVLYEAEWRKAVPVDPMLVRRMGKSDMWIVLGVWELTAVERAVLAGQLQ